MGDRLSSEEERQYANIRVLGGIANEWAEVSRKAAETAQILAETALKATQRGDDEGQDKALAAMRMATEASSSAAERALEISKRANAVTG